MLEIRSVDPARDIYEWTTASVVLKKQRCWEYKDLKTWKGKACSEATAEDQQGIPSVEGTFQRGQQTNTQKRRARRAASL